MRCASSGRKAGEKEGSTPERNAPERNWSLQQRQGHRWHEGLLWPNELPHIDWTRYHIKVRIEVPSMEKTAVRTKAVAVAMEE